MKDYGQSTRR